MLGSLFYHEVLEICYLKLKGMFTAISSSNKNDDIVLHTL